MAMKSLTFGTFPPREEFDAAFNAACPDGVFRVENDGTLGNATMSCDQTWRMLHGMCADMYDGYDEIGGEWWRDFRREDAVERHSTASAVMGCLGFEWV